MPLALNLFPGIFELCPLAWDLYQETISENDSAEKKGTGLE